MGALLLARCRRVADDVGHLRSELGSMLDACDVRPGNGLCQDLCAYCREGSPFLEALSRCETMLNSLRSDLNDLVDSTLRHLGTLALMDTIATYGNGDAVRGSELRKQALQSVVGFFKLEGAIDEVRTRCTFRQLAFARSLTDRLAVTIQGLDTMLRTDLPQASTSRWLVQ